MAGLIREHDWTASPLGPIGSWPESLRSTVGLILNVPQAMWIGWGPNFVQIYNDAYMQLLDAERHRSAFGRPASETWADTWTIVEPQLKSVLTGGPALLHADHPMSYRHRGEVCELYYTSSFSPIPDGHAPLGVGGVLCVATETTPAFLLREAQERQTFLLDLSDRLRALSDPRAIIDTAQEALGRHLGANRVGYGEVEETARYFTTERNWTDRTVPSREGTHDLAGFGPEVLAALRAGVPLLIQDAASDPRTNSPTALAAFDAIDTRAVITASLVKDSRMRAALYVHAKKARPWTERDSALVTEVAERTWSAVERARAETDLRESEERFRAITEQAEVGVWLTDWNLRFLYANDTYARIVGRPLDEIIGRSVEELMAPEDWPNNQRLFDRLLAEGTPFVVEKRYVRRAGPAAWVRNSLGPRRDASGRIIGVIAVVVDVTERRGMQERLQLATDAASLGIFDVDLITGAADWDARLREIWGFSPDEAVTDEIFIEGVQPHDRAALRAAVAKASDPDGDHLYVAEYRVRHRVSGRECWIAARGRAHFQGRQPVRLIGTVQDITERKRSEAILRHLNETLEQRVADALAERKLLADVFEGTDAMISVADTDLRLLAFNRPYADEVERLGGHRPRVGDCILDLYADQPELAAPVKANWTRAVRGEVFSITQEHGDPERYRRSYERRFEPVYDRAGRLIGAYQFATDVTERLRDQRRADKAEEARRDADALYRAYFESASDALFVIRVEEDGGFTIEQVNPAHEAQVGFPMEVVAGKRIEEVLPPGLAEQVRSAYHRVVESGRVYQYREAFDLPAGRQHWDNALAPVIGADGRISRIFGSSRNVTPQVQAEEALRQSQKMEAMGQLTGGVAHDFNNLLTPILGGLDRLQRKGVGDERDRMMIDGALQSAERARTLVQRLLSFARRQPLQPKAVDVAEVVRGMADLVASTTGPQVKVVLEVGPDLPAALADTNQLEMALLNLVVNARDAMVEGGTLRVSVTDEVVGREPSTHALAPGRYLRLSVADTGVGMDEATLARAVEPFFSTKGVGRGTGLGLSMVHGLAAQLGGALTINSRPGLGTNVELWLPVASDIVPVSSAPSENAEETTALQTKGLVLLVDDEDLVRATAADMLAELGYAVVEAKSADEALRHLSEGLAPDFVITDHLMPGLTGTELAQIVQTQHPGVPVLVISGYADVEGIAPGLPRLAKPFRRAELAASLQALRSCSP